MNPYRSEGLFGYQIPIAVPPGRTKATTPDLSVHHAVYSLDTKICVQLTNMVED